MEIRKLQEPYHRPPGSPPAKSCNVLQHRSRVRVRFSNDTFPVSVVEKPIVQQCARIPFTHQLHALSRELFEFYEFTFVNCQTGCYLNRVRSSCTDEGGSKIGSVNEVEADARTVAQHPTQLEREQSTVAVNIIN